jgi:prepilin-type N-terminal cleavage/methylation domain-containing protein/prepilin-type processing-associated H-X9-DG protein
MSTLRSGLVPRTAGRRQAFTLIELLAVIAIIIILLALLMPAWENMRRRVDAVHCMANERQLGLAVLAFCNDHQQQFPPRYMWGPYWQTYLVDDGYLPNYETLSCPVRMRGGQTITRHSFGYSDWTSYNQNGCCPRLLTSVQKWAITPLFAESNNYRFNEHNAAFLPVERHQGKLHVCWMDGHLSAITKADFYSPPYFHGSRNPKNTWGQLWQRNCGNADQCPRYWAK